MPHHFFDLHLDCRFPGFTSSIPTTFQTVVIRNEEKKGFSSQTKRFLSQGSLNENPGPGAYSSVASAEVNSPSFSKKGTSGFASKAARVPRNPQRGIPGPNAYNLQSSLLNKYNFGRGVSRAFRSPVTVPFDGPKYNTPAPNQYDKCPKISISPFKSKTERFPAPVDNGVPGPGTYNPHLTPEPVKKSVLPRRHYLPISAPPKDPPLPGPGQYDIVDYEGPPKQLMSTAAFVSGSRLTLQDLRGQVGPGPGSYDPRMLSKQSFLCKNPKIWIPT
ncbi:O(6)-methylguanine-induced apoptosis 2 [Polymixia lowei]